MQEKDEMNTKSPSLNLPKKRNAVMTILTAICSHVNSESQIKSRSMWEKREWAQEGMNLGRILLPATPFGLIVYLYFLKKNLELRWTPPTWLGWIFFATQIIHLKLKKLTLEIPLSPDLPIENEDFQKFISSFGHIVFVPMEETN